MQLGLDPKDALGTHFPLTAYRLTFAVSLYSPEEEEEKTGEKIYLYMHLKQQPIW